jgi:NADP-dependent 3-hydroxy acid dehydrogenase YdfG
VRWFPAAREVRTMAEEASDYSGKVVLMTGAASGIGW